MTIKRIREPISEIYLRALELTDLDLTCMAHTHPAGCDCTTKLPVIVFKFAATS